MVRKISAFEKRFPEQAEGANKLKEDYRKDNYQRTSCRIREVNEKLNSFATSALNKDALFRLTNGKRVKLNQAVKKQIKEDAFDFVRWGVMERVSTNGVCLVCGKSFEPGDISVEETDGSGNVVCLDCCADGVVLSKEGLFRLYMNE